MPSGFWANEFFKASFVGSGMAAHHAFFGVGAGLFSVIQTLSRGEVSQLIFLKGPSFSGIFDFSFLFGSGFLRLVGLSSIGNC